MIEKKKTKQSAWEAYLKAKQPAWEAYLKAKQLEGGRE